jgi:hypothetical protein
MAESEITQAARAAVEQVHNDAPYSVATDVEIWVAGYTAGLERAGMTAENFRCESDEEEIVAALIATAIHSLIPKEPEK